MTRTAKACGGRDVVRDVPMGREPSVGATATLPLARRRPRALAGLPRRYMKAAARGAANNSMMAIAVRKCVGIILQSEIDLDMILPSSTRDVLSDACMMHAISRHVAYVRSYIVQFPSKA